MSDRKSRKPAIPNYYSIPYDDRVKIYWNSRRKIFSIWYNGRVVGYRECIELRDVEFTVSEAGRQRVLKTGRKNVHAFCVGIIVNTGDKAKIANGNLMPRITYNPWYAGDFLCNKKPILTAGSILMNGRMGVFLLKP